MTARRPGLVLLLVAFLASHPAAAGLTRQQIERAAADPQIGANLPLDQAFASRDGGTATLRQAIGGRPSLLVFADLTCTTLCGVTLSIVAGVLARTAIQPGRDFSLIVASIDPKDDAADAERLAAAQLGDGTLARAAAFLIGPGVERLAAAAGFGYAYDAEHDAYAHPVGLYVLGPGGEIVRYLPGLELDAETLAGALDRAGGQAGTGPPPSLASRLLLLCYRFDPVTGRYTPTITAIMTAAGAATALLVALGVGLLLLRERRVAGDE